VTGHRATCTAEHADRRSAGELTLTGDTLRFSGEFDVTIPIAAIDMLRVHREVLEVVWPGGTAAFHLGGRSAQDWADLIRAPLSPADKLGIRRGARVLVCGVADFPLRRALVERAAVVLDKATAARGPAVGVAIQGVGTVAELAALRSVLPLLAADGVLWGVRPAAGDAVTEEDVRDAARDAGLLLIKTVDVSSAHTAHKLVAAPGRRE